MRERVTITGASGLIGRALARSYERDGVAVTRVGRGTSADVRWNVERGELDGAALGAPGVVVHLAGAPIATLWTAAAKRAMRASRVHSTALIARTIAALPVRPRVLLCAGGVGFYGNRGDEVLTEESVAGADFLAALAQEWEAASQPAADAGIRVVHLRFGIVLSRHGGALRAMLPAFRFGLGGPFGSGTQWMSWVALDDVVNAIRFVAAGVLGGAVNVVSPNPATNREFVKTLGEVLGRPTVLRVPAFVLRGVLGEMADAALLVSQRAVPQRLLAAGFTFAEPALAGALRRALRDG